MVANMNQFILNKYGVAGPSPIVIPGMGRMALYKLFAELGYTIGCEIGVQRGRNAAVMIREIPGLQLYLVDPYANHPSTGRRWPEKDLQKFRRMAYERLKNDQVIWHEEFSEDAIRHFPNDSLDFVYIDGDHTYDFVMIDIILWSRKVRKGGIVSGHDYNYRNKSYAPRKRVMGAVNDYVEVHGISSFFLTDKKAPTGDRQDTAPSWFWVKQ
jgi:predicted O-methyltransferase YrrM